MMFPEESDVLQTDETEDTGNGMSLGFDYTESRFLLIDGKNKTVEGVEAVKQWVELFLRTRPGVYRVYDNTGFGVDTRALINRRRLPEGFVRSEFERQVKGGIQLNPYVDYVDQFNYERNGRQLIVSFIVHLKNGESTEVTTNV